MKYLLAAALSLIPASAFGARAIMEGIWASSTSVFVSTPSQLIELGAGGVKFADGTTQTTAAGATGGWNIVRSSGSADQTNATSNWAPVVGSTVSITVAANSQVLILAHLTVSHNTSNVGCQFRLMNGGVVMSATGIDCAFYAFNSSARPGSCVVGPYLTASQSASTQNYSLMFRSAGSGTCQIDGATTAPWHLVAAEAP